MPRNKTIIPGTTAQVYHRIPFFDLRKLRGWTQEEFATKLQIKRSLLGAYEEERAEPRIDVLELVGELFKLTLDELLLKDLAETKGNYLAKRRAQ